MTPAAALPSSTAADPALSARARIERRMAVLARLTEIGMEIAEACGREARAAGAAAAAEAAAGDDTDAAPSPALAPRRDPGLVFARVARAVRMTIALEARLMKDLAELDRVEGLAQAQEKRERRSRLSRLLDQAARAGVEAQRMSGARRWSGEDAIDAEVDRLSEEAYERLTDAEDGELFDLSFEDAVAAVCNDLGLSPEWRERLWAAVTPPAVTGAAAPAAAPLATPSDGPPEAQPTAPPQGLPPPRPEPPAPPGPHSSA